MHVSFTHSTFFTAAAGLLPNFKLEDVVQFGFMVINHGSQCAHLAPSFQNPESGLFNKCFKQACFEYTGPTNGATRPLYPGANNRILSHSLIMTFMAVLHLRPIAHAGTVSLDHFLYLGGGFVSNSKLNWLREALFLTTSLPATKP